MGSRARANALAMELPTVRAQESRGRREGHQMVTRSSGASQSRSDSVTPNAS